MSDNVRDLSELLRARYGPRLMDTEDAAMETWRQMFPYVPLRPGLPPTRWQRLRSWVEYQWDRRPRLHFGPCEDRCQEPHGDEQDWDY